MSAGVVVWPALVLVLVGVGRSLVGMGSAVGVSAERLAVRVVAALPLTSVWPRWQQCRLPPAQLRYRIYRLLYRADIEYRYQQRRPAAAGRLAHAGAGSGVGDDGPAGVVVVDWIEQSISELAVLGMIAGEEPRRLRAAAALVSAWHRTC